MSEIQPERRFEGMTRDDLLRALKRVSDMIDDSKMHAEVDYDAAKKVLRLSSNTVKVSANAEKAIKEIRYQEARITAFQFMLDELNAEFGAELFIRD